MLHAKRLCYWVALWVLLLGAKDAHAQTSRPMACPSGIAPGMMSDPWGINYQGQWWASSWTLQFHPNPDLRSRAVYTANENPIISRSGKWHWQSARIQVSCIAVEEYVFGRLVIKVLLDWSYYSGAIVKAPGEECDTSIIEEEEYDPFDPTGSVDECDDDPNTGSDDTDPPMEDCYEDYLIVEVSYDGGVTWHLLWEGWAQVCS